MEQTGPRHLGPYVVLEQIGTGGMGAVYRARDRRLERDVAIKVLHRNLEMVGARERFLREARAVSSLNHPNISTIFDIGEQDGDPYLVMELLHGESLKERLQDGARISPSELVMIASHSAQALTAAHAKGIVHRDIKPANLFLVDGPHGEKQLKMLDFGLAKMESDRALYGNAGLTRTGSTVGTVEYMSPEQARGEELDARSDLFSLGAVLYELATGDVPFRGATSAVVFAELLGNDPVPPRMANANVSPGMDSIIRRLLEKKLEQRIQSAAQLLDELKKLSQVAIPVRSMGPPRTRITSVPDDAPVRPPSRSASQPPSSKESDKTVRGSGGQRPEQRHVVPVTDPDVRSQRPRPVSGSRPSTVRPRASGAQPSGFHELLPWDDSGEVPIAEDGVASENRGISSRWIAVVVVVLVLGIALAAYLRKFKGSPVERSTVFHGTLQVTPFDNATGNTVLQEAPAVAMQILLREMPGLRITGYAPGTNAMEIARRSGADAYLTGSVSRDDGRYHVHAALLRTTDGSPLAQEDVVAASMEELPGAFSRLSVVLRTHLGETPEQANANTVQLAYEATGSLNALALYARGALLLRSGQTISAIQQFERALAEDPAFVVARLDLLDALRESGAEVERVRAANALQASAGKVSPCTKARIAYEVADSVMAQNAAEQWSAACPFQPEAQIALARQFLANGKGAEAEAAGVKAATFDPSNRVALALTTEAMIAQDHYEAAQKQQKRAGAMEASSPGLTLLAAYLRGDAAVEAEAGALAEGSPVWQDQWDYLTYLSNRGRLDDAARFVAATAARLQPEVASTAVLLRTRLAAIQAMAGHCEATAMDSTGGGELADFYGGLARAWCKHATGAQAVEELNLGVIVHAATVWSKGEPQRALTLLQAARASAQAPVAVMVRGESHLALKQQVLAIGDYQAVITKRGAALLTGTLVYPAAQAGLATAYSTMGDMPNSTSVQDELKAQWKDALPTEPLLRRAEK
jgi:serine/threonine-protein kinase